MWGYFKRKKDMKKIENQVADYLEWCEFTKKFTPATLKTKREAIKRFMKETEVKDLSKLSNTELERWHQHLARVGLRGKSINNYQDHVIGCLKFLRDKRDFSLKINLENVDRAEEELLEAIYFTPQEVKQIKRNCRGLRDYLLVSLLFDSGMRIMEVSKLKMESIKGKEIVVKGKGRKERVTFMLDNTQEILERWTGMNDITRGFIFPSPVDFDKPLSIQQIRQVINFPIKESGLKGSAHSLRHAFGTAMINNGADIFTTQTMLGHADTNTTRRYYHVTREELAKRHAKYMSV